MGTFCSHFDNMNGWVHFKIENSNIFNVLSLYILVQQTPHLELRSWFGENETKILYS